MSGCLCPNALLFEPDELFSRQTTVYENIAKSIKAWQTIGHATKIYSKYLAFSKQVFLVYLPMLD